MFKKKTLKIIFGVVGFLLLSIFIRDLWYVLVKGYVYNESVLNQVIGFSLGILTNFLVWWFLLHGLSPELEFSNSISKIKTKSSSAEDPRYSYRIKLINSGSRDVIDVELMADLVLKGIGKFKKNWKHYYITFSSNGEKVYRIMRMSPGRGNGRVLHLKINKVDLFKHNKVFPQEFREKAMNNRLTLEDVFGLDPSAYIQVYAFGYDGFSGSRKLFLSKRFTPADIAEGAFEYSGLGISQTKKPLIEEDEETGIEVQRGEAEKDEEDD